MSGRVRFEQALKTWDCCSGPLELDSVLVELQMLDLQREDFLDAIYFEDQLYQRTLIHSRPHFEALILCWKSGQRSPIHDHRGSKCAVRVVEGRATEIRYEVSPCGMIVPEQSTKLSRGEVTGCQGDDMHQMANLEPPGIDLITLHVYSPPASGCAITSWTRPFWLITIV